MSSADHLSRLLEVERAAAPPSGTADAELKRLLSSLATHAPPLAVATGSLKLGWTMIAKWIGVGFAVGVAGAGAASFAAKTEPAPPSALVPIASNLAPSRAPVPLPRTTIEPRPSVESMTPAAPPAKRTAAPPSAVPAPPPSAVPGLDEELRLLTAAKRELDQGHAHLARVWLDEHRQRFAGGVFALEREGLWVLAACAGAANAAAAHDFARRYPESPMLAQVLRRCGAEAASTAVVPAGKDFAEADK